MKINNRNPQTLPQTKQHNFSINITEFNFISCSAEMTKSAVASYDSLSWFINLLMFPLSLYFHNTVKLSYGGLKCEISQFYQALQLNRDPSRDLTASLGLVVFPGF